MKVSVETIPVSTLFLCVEVNFIWYFIVLGIVSTKRKEWGSDRMKAIQVTGYGDVDKLEVRELEIPEPKAHEVLIRVKACAINNTEIPF